MIKLGKRKLALQKETLVNLTPDEIGGIQGGTLPSMPPPTFLCGIVHNSLKYCAIVHTTSFGRGCNDATKKVTNGCFSAMC
jgi:hypothetical protein